MKLDDLQKKLIAAARLNPPSDHVPYAFEKRIMAHLAARSSADRWILWTRGLWRAAASCVLVAVVCGVISFCTSTPPDKTNDLSQDFENTLLASVDQGDVSP